MSSGFKKGFTTLRAPVGGAVLGKTVNAQRARPFPYHKTERPKVVISPTYLQSLRLTQRDRAMLVYIHEIGYVTAEQIGALFFGHVKQPEKKAGERLFELWQQHLLDRFPAEGLAKYGLKDQLVYVVGQAGVLLLSELDPDGNRPKVRRGGVLLAHNLLLGEALLRLTETARARDWAVMFHGERTAFTTFEHDGRFVKMRPDGVVIVQRDEGEIPFFVELDTGTEVLETYKQKVLQYELYSRSQRWREQYTLFPGILVVVQCGGDTPELRGKRTHARLTRLIDQVQSCRREGLRWFFSNLAQAGAGNWQAIDRKGELREAQLFPSMEQS